MCFNIACSPTVIRDYSSHRNRDGTSKKSINAQYTDRIIDIDILLYDKLNINEPDLIIPHPLMEEREFVMLPLKEIWED